MTRRWLALGAAVALGSFAFTACGDDGGGSSSGSDDFCDLVSEVEASFDDIGDVVDDPDELKSQFEAVIDKMEEAVDAVPDDGKDAVEASLAAYKRLFALLEDNDFDFAATQEDDDFSDVSEELDETSSDLESFVSDECDIDFSDDSDASDASDFSDLSDLSDLSDFSDASDFSDITDFDSGDVEQAAIEQLQRIFPKLDEDQARCLLENGMDIQASAEDPTAFLDILDECGISITDLQP